MNTEPTPQSAAPSAKYNILERLAVGGMAELFLAEIESLHGFRKKVVIKQMLPQYVDDPQYVEMFLDEARLVARLNHASIVQVFDIGRGENGVFFAMEYVDGFVASNILRNCYRNEIALELEEVLAIAIPIAEALDHAHNLKGDDDEPLELVHRDVSPSNIIVNTEGRVKLLDFGVAKSNAQLCLTIGNSVKGKLGYMAPEQIRGESLDKRCDIFSFGIVFWELLVGKRLFPGTDRGAVKQILENKIEPPSNLRPSLPPEIDEICLKALSWDREDRYSSLRELLDDLDSFSLKYSIVRTSGTLKKMIKKLYPDGRRSNTMNSDEAARLSIPTGISSTVSQSSVTPGSQLHSKEEEAKQKKGIFWILALGLVAFALLFLLFSGGDDTDSKVAETSVQPATTTLKTIVNPSNPAETTATYSVQLKTLPPEADIEIDGKLVGRGTFTSSFPSDQKEHQIRIFANGYQEVRLKFKDHDLVQTITLDPIETAVPAPTLAKDRDSKRNGDSKRNNFRRKPKNQGTATAATPTVKTPATPPASPPKTPKKDPKLGGGSDNLDPWN